jgi:hypothetical protein
MQKQKYFNKEIQHNLKWKKNYHHPIFVKYKNKSHQFIFSLLLHKRKWKNIQEKKTIKILIWNKEKNKKKLFF